MMFFSEAAFISSSVLSLTVYRMASPPFVKVLRLRITNIQHADALPQYSETKKLRARNDIDIILDEFNIGG
jgi:hypothetical protein